MLLAGDFDGLENVLDWASAMIPLLSARSQLLLPEHSSGIYVRRRGGVRPPEITRLQPPPH